MKRVASKEDGERNILNRFVAAYRKQFGVELRMLSHRDRPDFAVTEGDSGCTLGIEVTAAYQDDDEAESEFGVQEAEIKFESSIDKVLESLNTRLANKAEKVKQYVFDGKIWLVILVASPVYNSKTDIQSFGNRLVIPDNLFEKVWLVIQNQSDYSPELYEIK
jgi:hypothetical protein